MNKSINFWVIVMCVGIFFALGDTPVCGQESAQAKDGVFRWGGSGYDSARTRESTRFTARLGKDDDTSGKAIVEILVDTRETWEDLAKLTLVSKDGKLSATSIRRGKSQRHITASWTCVFFTEDVKQLPDDGLIVAKDSNGKQILSEKTDFRPIKTIIMSAKITKMKPLPNKKDAGDGK